MGFSRRFPVLASLAALLAVSAMNVDTARGAGITIVRVDVREIPDPNYRYTFDLFLTEGSVVDGSLTDGDFLTIYDVIGVFPGTNLQPDNWALTNTDFLGVDPDAVGPPFLDDPTIRNLTWRFIAPIDDIAVPIGEAGIFLGQFSIQAFADFPQTEFKIGSRTTLPNGDKLPVYSVVIVPEPSTFVLAAPALLFLGRSSRRRLV